MEDLDSSGGPNEGSMSSVSKTEIVEQDYVGLSEVSSYTKTPGIAICREEGEEKELELGLGLSLAVGKNNGRDQKECCRILTAKDFSSMMGVQFYDRKINERTVVGNKRACGSLAPEVGDSVGSQVVGWPPIRSFRMNSLVNQAKVSSNENRGNKDIVKKDNIKNKGIKEKNNGSSTFVKVNMDGVPIGRKVDLSAHVCYESLARFLEEMFQTSENNNPVVCNKTPMSMEKSHGIMMTSTDCPKFLDGSSGFVLTYEDKEGDWMLVGDVPWRMFLKSVKRLRIMRSSEAQGLGQIQILSS